MLAGEFVLFGPAHLAILALTPATAWGLSRISRGNATAVLRARISLGVFLLGNEAGWYWFRYSHEGFRFPENLPLQLCDITLLATGLAALTAASWLFDFAYFAGMGGAAVAILTPDLWAPWPTYPSIYYFLAHCGMIVTTLVLLWTGVARPRPGSVWRTFVVLNLFALAVGIFNLAFGTNYMYLCRKPDSSTLLDLFGPWPVYLLAGEAFALVLFWMMWLPFRRRSAH
jgi:hypothetical integral membrane protein (TIGR02206 family)